MGQTIISAIGVYISTSIDYLIILIILFAQLSQNKQKWHIYAGQYLGTGLLVGASLVAAYVVNFMPEEWMVGLLGLIPIYLGIRFAIVGEGEEEEEEIIERLEQVDCCEAPRLARLKAKLMLRKVFVLSLIFFSLISSK